MGCTSSSEPREEPRPASRTGASASVPNKSKESNSQKSPAPVPAPNNSNSSKPLPAPSPAPTNASSSKGPRPACLNLSCKSPGATVEQPDVCSSCGTSLLIQGRFRVTTILGIGGFGRTMIGWDLKSPTHSPANPTKVVVKQFCMDTSTPDRMAFCAKAKELFIKEALQLKKLGIHKNIPTMLAHADEKDGWLLVQEFIDGIDCYQDMRSGWVWTEAKLIAFLRSVLTTLAYVHENQVIHRDIKPANIMRRLSDGEYVLIDFGAAKEVTRDIVLNRNTSIGTTGYIAPEIGRGECYYNSDLYSLAATVVFFMTRTEPADVKPSVEYYKTYLRIPISQKFAYIIDQCLSFDPRQRPLRAIDVLSQLDAVISSSANSTAQSSK